ncbi:MAG: tetratricopeptide repeat protein [Myxococcota bacterium]
MKNRTLYILFALCAALPYITTLNYPFVYDDKDGIVNNVFIQDITNLEYIFMHNGMRPVLFFTYAINYAFSDTAVWSYRLVNILIHIFATILIFVTLSKLLAHKTDRERARTIAIIAALFFALHPIQTETVIYISSRSSGLATLMFLLGLYVFLRFREARKPKKKFKFYILFCLIFFPGTLVKEDFAVLPIFLFILDVFWLREKDSQYDAEKYPQAKINLEAKLLAFHLPFFLLLIAVGTNRLVKLLRAEIEMSPLPRSVAENLLTQSNSIIKYVGLLFYPKGQNIAHGYFFLPPEFDFSFVVSIFTIIFIIFTAIILFKRVPIFTFAVFWFFITISPSSSFFPLQENMAEHRLYLPSIGAFIIMASIILTLSQALFPLSAQKQKKAYFAFVIALCIIFGAITFVRGREWKSELSIWGDAIEKNPNYWGSHYAYADALRAEGRFKEAIPHYFLVNALHGEDPDALINLGICFFEMGERDKAPKFWLRGLEVVSAILDSGKATPEVPFMRDKLQNNLARYYYLKGDFDAAEGFYFKTLAHDRKNVIALKGLALIALNRGHFQEARRYFEEASWLFPKGSKERRELEKSAAEISAHSDAPQPPLNPYD